MRYTDFIPVLSIFLCACAATPADTPAPAASQHADATPATTADLEIIQYTTALNLLNVNQLDQAEVELKGITAKHPELAGPWANLALIDIKQNHPDKARINLTKALEKNPNLAQANNLLGYLEYSEGNIIKAKQYYSKALVNKEDYAVAHYNLALIYDIYLHDIPNAVIHYQRYLQLIKSEDKSIADWVVELQSHQKKAQP